MPATKPTPQQKHAKARGAQQPINAAAAAKRAARASQGNEIRYRQAAAGTTRTRAEQLGRDARRSGHRGALIGAVIGLALAVLVIVLVGRAVLGVLLYDDCAARTATTSTEAAAAQSAATENAVAAANGSIAFLSNTYSIEPRDDGTYTFSYQITGSEAAPLPAFTITGDPVGFALYEGTFYIVSNTDGAHLVQSFVYGDGALPVTVGEATGTVANIELEGSALHLTDDAGALVETIAFDRS